MTQQVPVSSAQAWLKAFRLRTLPLSLSTILMGSILAWHQGFFNARVFGLAMLTTLFLQILSNLANDYGDFLKGTDNHERIGPERALQSGNISVSAMKKSLIVFVLLSLISGIWLIIEGTKDLEIGYAIFFFLLGIAAIAAAIKYTAGKNPYGYSGLGDIFVFLFFGIVGVCGTFYLHSGQFSFLSLLPAASMGFFSTGVLNLNNMRDREPDQRAGKITLAVRLGFEKAKTYHFLLIIFGWISAILYYFLAKENGFTSLGYPLFLLALPLFVKQLFAISSIQLGKEFDPFLKKLAISTTFFTLLFVVAAVISS